jgi:hypothetical protein
MNFSRNRTLLIAATLLLSVTGAMAREMVAARGGAVAGRGFVAARGYGYGYGYGYPVSTTVNVAAPAPAAPSLPSGYIATLPPGAAPVVVFGKTYYFANGNYYSPVFYAGSTGYMPANP